MHLFFIAGIIVLILCGIISSYTGGLLGKCWVIIKRRYPEYDDKHIADPYPTIGFRAAGKWGRMATRFCIVFTLFGSGKLIALLRILHSAVAAFRWAKAKLGKIQRSFLLFLPTFTKLF